MPGISQCFSFGQNVQQPWEVLLRNVKKRQINGSQYETLGGKAPSRHTGRLVWFCAGGFEKRLGELLQGDEGGPKRAMTGDRPVVLRNEAFLLLITG